jgi:ribose transport system permease protein
VQKEISDSENEKKLNSALFFAVFIAALTVIASVVNCFTDGMFLEAKNAQIILSNSIYPTFIAWALCFLFACGYTDLSLGGVVILGSFAACAFGNLYGYPGVILGGLITGTLPVFINFTIFAFTKIPSWIAGISLAMIYEAISVWLRANSVTRPYIDAELNRDFRALGQFPMNVILLVAGFIIVYFVFNRMNVGLNIRAVGGNEAVSRSLGVNVLKTLLWVGLICGLLIGAASFIQQSYNVKTTTMTGLMSIQLLFKPLAITLLAQILQRWINIIVATPFCSLIIYAAFNGMTFFGVPSGTLQDICLCAFLIAFGIGGQRGVKEVVK